MGGDKICFVLLIVVNKKSHNVVIDTHIHVLQEL